MNWVLITVIILTGEMLLVALFWEKIAEIFASYAYLFDKGEKAFQAGNREKALSLLARVAGNSEFQSLPGEHPVKLIVYQRLASLYYQLALEQENRGEQDHGQQYYQEALLYKIKELQLKGEWEQLQEKQAEIVELRLRLAQAYWRNNTSLPEALQAFFDYGQWGKYLTVYNHFSKQLAYYQLNPAEKELMKARAGLAREILKYRQGVEQILNGKETGKKDVDCALAAISGILNNNMDYLMVDEPLFNEIKEKLGHVFAGEIQELAAAGEELKESETRETGKGEAGVPMPENIQGKEWGVIVRQLRKQSRVVTSVTERTGEVIIEVQTEWYLLPLIFQEELVERVAQTYYVFTRKKKGSVSFIFKDNKGREVARQTLLGVRIYQ